MRNATLALLCLTMTTICHGADWLTLPSTFTHDPMTMQRVSQYAAIEAPTTAMVSDFETSGYTHMRSSLNYGQSADNYHRVESWGPPVRPYGEWRFPYRPYSTPYANWGAPYAGLNLGPNFFGGGFVPPTSPGRPWPGHPDADQPGSERPGVGHPGLPGNPSNPFPPAGLIPQLPDRDWPSQRHQGQGTIDAGSLNPYPFGPATPYPSAPYYDGYHPVYRD